MAGLGLVGMVFFAILTAVGGGILTDIVTGEKPSPFSDELYVFPAAIGGSLYWLIDAHRETFIATSIVLLVPFTIRIGWLARRGELGFLQSPASKFRDLDPRRITAAVRHPAPGRHRGLVQQRFRIPPNHAVPVTEQRPGRGVIDSRIISHRVPASGRRTPLSSAIQAARWLFTVAGATAVVEGAISKVPDPAECDLLRQDFYGRGFPRFSGEIQLRFCACPRAEHSGGGYGGGEQTRTGQPRWPLPPAPGMGRGRRDQALRRRLAVPRAAHRSAGPRQAERPSAAGNPPPSPGLRVPPGSTGRLLQLAEPPHPRRVTPRGGRQQRIRDDLAVRSPDSGREILRATGADQQLRTSAPCRTVRLPRHVPDLPAGELLLKLAPALTVPHGLPPPSTLSNTPIPRPRVPAARRAAAAFACATARRPGQPQLTGACPRKPTGTRQALRRAAPGANDLASGTVASPAPSLLRHRRGPGPRRGKRGLSHRRPGRACADDR